MQGQCSCEHHTSQKSCSDNRILHIVSLIQNNFVSPYKILFLLDPKQADHFKLRNQSSGCCASNHITIPTEKLTKLEKTLKELISQRFLLSELDAFLSYCYQKYNNIIQSGKKDQLQVTPEVEKFLLDKVMAESINHLIFTKLSETARQESAKTNKEIGLWATPATWYQKYPNQRLDFLPGQFISALFTKEWAVLPDFPSNHKQLFRELSTLEKDGKFEEAKWMVDVKAKILNNPERYIEIKTSNNGFLFEQTREFVMKISSIPFELNAKANLYCTVSPNLHVLYSNQQFETCKMKGSLKYTVLINVGGTIKVKINEEPISLENSSLLMIDNAKAMYQIQNKQQQIFLVINYIGCAQRK